MKKLPIVLVLLFLFPIVFQAQNVNTEKSVVDFKINNLVFSNVKGTFKEMTGTLNMDPENLSDSFINVCISAKSVNTGNDKRDAHLRSEDFFYVANNPNICYVSTTISRSEDGFTTTGKLTILGVSRDVTIPFTYKNNTFIGAFKINRTDYHLGKNENPFVIGEMVKIKITCLVS
ncbi:YceI family protein [Lacinutrix sp. C3R15]|uniref:YceI family protein n=1 Tax=Flavobacteriaceae TaxID=49546 RepID=UPI001C09E7E4|nr:MULTISPECIES: YceI family protein [Flavobacteriaceae]MBU2939705.1 YceI family protein [Lacinutrix sp. C3R15]MDO6623020.1 YceI family protein [Oceanihabitans sp. 1_MG-2023]